MANYILKQGFEILRCSNWAMEALYENLKETIKIEGLGDNEMLINFLEQLNQNIYGRGCVYVDIADFFNNDPNKLPIMLLIDLIEKTLKNIIMKSSFDASFIKLLKDFQQKLVFPKVDMPANVLITKYIERDPLIYYSVNAVDYGDQKFYVAVNQKEQTITFYKDYSFPEALGQMNLSDPHTFYNEIPGIYPDVAMRVAFQVYKALKNNSLATDISYISH
jgi:hypothetical protein